MLQIVVVHEDIEKSFSVIKIVYQKLSWLKLARIYETFYL